MPSDGSPFQTPKKTEPLRRTRPAPGRLLSQKKSTSKKELPPPFQFAPSSPFNSEVKLNGSSGSSPDDIIAPRRLLNHTSAPGASVEVPLAANQPSGSSSNKKKKSRTVYLIRHGQSQGQASRSLQARQTDPSLTDCGLTAAGQEQARNMPANFPSAADYERVDWVLSSPLTRALETAVLAFPNRPILCHYDLREIGSTNIPENIPRRTQDVLAHLQAQCLDDASRSNTSSSSSDHAMHMDPKCPSARIDFVSLRPESWPRYHDTPPKVVRRDRVQQVFGWLAQIVPDHVRDIAVVCHYHVIRAALSLSDPYNQAHVNYVHKHVCPENAQPIACELTADGKLRLKVKQTNCMHTTVVGSIEPMKL